MIMASIWHGSTFVRGIARLFSHPRAETFDGIAFQTFFSVAAIGLIVSGGAWLIARVLPAPARTVGRFIIFTGFLLLLAPAVSIITPMSHRPQLEDLATRLGGRYGLVAVLAMWLASLTSMLIDVGKRIRHQVGLRPDVRRRALVGMGLAFSILGVLGILFVGLGLVPEAKLGSSFPSRVAWGMAFVFTLSGSIFGTGLGLLLAAGLVPKENKMEVTEPSPPCDVATRAAHED